ncbi:hypothetical protein ACFL6I_09205 [candidate division KSB1 bacterium]
MVLQKVLTCPKCGSNNIGWHNNGTNGNKECKACGHMNHFQEKEIEVEDEIIFP